jgi:hypothetical protein
MRIKGKVAGDLLFLGSKRYGETNTRMAKATLAVKVQEKEAAKKFGADFHRVAFGAMQVKEDKTVSFPCGVMTKPNLTMEMHEAKLFDHTFRVALEIPKITPCDDERAVVVSLVMPIEVTELKKEFFGELTCASGDVVEVEFNPVQMEIPGTDSGMTVKRKDGKFGNPTPQLVEG